jgi:hypothetical protein
VGNPEGISKECGKGGSRFVGFHAFHTLSLCAVHVRWLMGCKSPIQPDGGEGLAKRKGVIARWGLKEAWSKGVRRWTRTGYEASTCGRVGNEQQSPYPSKASAGKSGGSALKAIELTTGDLLHVVDSRLERERFFLNVQQKSAEGIVGHVVGKANEALQSRKAESTARQSRERWTKA